MSYCVLSTLQILIIAIPLTYMTSTVETLYFIDDTYGREQSDHLFLPINTRSLLVYSHSQAQALDRRVVCPWIRLRPEDRVLVRRETENEVPALVRWRRRRYRERERADRGGEKGGRGD